MYGPDLATSIETNCETSCVCKLMVCVHMCMLILAHIDCQVDVYERVPACVGVCCSFISQGRNADEAWPNKLIKP